LSFEILILSNGQPDHDDHRIIVVAMTSSKEQRSLVWTDLRQPLKEVCIINV